VVYNRYLYFLGLLIHFLNVSFDRVAKNLRILMLQVSFRRLASLCRAFWREILHKVDASCESLPREVELGSRLKKMYGERLGDGVEYHLMSPTPHC